MLAAPDQGQLYLLSLNGLDSSVCGPCEVATMLAALLRHHRRARSMDLAEPECRSRPPGRGGRRPSAAVVYVAGVPPTVQGVVVHCRQLWTVSARYHRRGEALRWRRRWRSGAIAGGIAAHRRRCLRQDRVGRLPTAGGHSEPL